MFEISSPPTLRPRSTAQNVFELLRGDIVAGVLKPGAAIRETELAGQLGVSRTPVREALLRLAHLGLVDIFPQSGIRVAPIRLDQIRAAHLIREAVDAEVVRRACGAITAAQLAELGHLAEDEAIAARRGDGGRLAELGEAFHRALYAAAGFAAAATALEEATLHLDRFRNAVADGPADAAARLEAHRAIVAALGERDPQRAAAALAAHSRTVLAVIEEVAARQGPAQ